MQKFLLIAGLILLVSCATISPNGSALTDDFYRSLATVNGRIEGVLSLDHFNRDLSTLTYDYYIDYLSKHEASSEQGVSNKVRSATMKHLKAAKDHFVLVLYYHLEHKVLIDRSNTMLLDSVFVVPEDKEVIDLQRFVP